MKLRFRTNYGSDRAIALGEVQIFEAIDTNEGIGGTIGRLEATINELEKWRKSQQEAGPGAAMHLVSTPGSIPSNVNMEPSRTAAKSSRFLRFFQEIVKKAPIRLMAPTN